MTSSSRSKKRRALTLSAADVVVAVAVLVVAVAVEEISLCLHKTDNKLALRFSSILFFAPHLLLIYLFVVTAAEVRRRIIESE